jgi:uncharacterized OB-fold protein
MKEESGVAEATTAAISNEEVFAAFPRVMLTPDNLEYFRGLLGHRLLINVCDACGYWIYPQRPLCPECWSTSITPTEVSGKGTVYMFTILYQGRPIAGFEYPHLIASVELPERAGLRYLAPIVNCEHADVHDGMAVELTWIDTDGGPVAAFAPAA